MRRIVSSIGIATLLVLLVAGAGLAQSFVPSLNFGTERVRIVENDVEELASSLASMTISARTELGYGLILSGVVGFGRSSTLEDAGTSVDIDTNRVTRFQANLGYGFDVGGLTVGPLVDFSHKHWFLEDGGVEVSYLSSALGLGAFVETQVDRIALHASYIQRPNAILRVKLGALTDETDPGNASTLTFNAALPVTSSLTINGGYIAENWYSNENAALRSSGFNLGITLLF